VTDLAEKTAILRLARSANIGPVTYRQLIARFGTAVAALDAVPALARLGGARAMALADVAAAEAEMEAAERIGARHLFLGLPPYPSLLAGLPDAPVVLTMKGHPRLFDQPAVGMVGARNASAAGCRFARQLAAELGTQGFAVASGLARGIDTAAHRGALDTGTIAVVAGGIDVVYPPENATLQAEIAAHGLLLAEQAPGSEPQARHFPRRNRIIAGLARGLVVVEAAPRSGSLITARQAADYGRDVMAVPGSPLDPRAQGCNQLIRDGATLIQSAADVQEALGPLGRSLPAEPAPDYRTGPVSPEVAETGRSAVLGLLGPTPVLVDELIRLAALPPAMVQTVLLELELAGRLDRHAGQRVSLRLI